MSETRIGHQVIYYDENRYAHAAIVAYVHHDILKHTDRRICNLAIFTPDGKLAARRLVEPAYHDGIRWHLLNKWAYPDELPEEEERDPNPQQGRLSFSTNHASIGK